MDRLIGTLAVIAVIGLSVIAGAWWSWKDGALFRTLLKPGFIGLESTLRLGALDHDPGNTDIWHLGGPSCETCGVQGIDRQAVSPGLTLVSAGQSAYLVDIEGAIIHSWTFDFRKLIGEPGVLLDENIPDTWLYWRPAHVYPNGDLLALVDAMHSSPQGLALIKLDAQSGLLWVQHRNVHHDFAIADDGRIFVLDQQIRKWPPAELGTLEGPLIDEGVAIISNEGQLLDRFSLLDAFTDTPFANLIVRTARLNRFPWGDYLHSNNLDLVSRADRQAAAWGQTEGLLLSFRNISTLALLDLGNRKMVWAERGSWYWQHDPDLLPNGKLLLFDNQGDWGRGGSSRILEFNPDDQQIAWRYPSADSEAQLWSFHRGEQQPLENGNLLINEFFQSRVLEVSPEGELVWEFHCPFRHRSRPELVCRPMWTRRYTASELKFLTIQ
jgi:hypothetical protein